MKRTIAVIGAGMMGSALAFPATENGNLVRIVDTGREIGKFERLAHTRRHPSFRQPFPKTVEFYRFEDWRKAVGGADFVVCGVSSAGVDWFYREILRNLDPAVPVLSVTKGLVGLEDGTLLSYPEYWERKLAAEGIERKICAVGGPCISSDLVFGDPTEVAFCGSDEDALRMMREALQTRSYNISLTRDVVGLETAVALKNVYGLAVAIAIGIDSRRHGAEDPTHSNSQAGAFIQAAREMRSLIRLQGGSEDAEFIGIGDLHVTVTGGRTRRSGILIGQGMSVSEAEKALPGMTLEGLGTAKVVVEAMRRKAERGLVDLGDYPLLMHLAGVLDEGGEMADIPWKAFTFEKI